MIHRDPREALDISNGTYYYSYSNGFSNPVVWYQWCPRTSRINRWESSCDNRKGTKLWTTWKSFGTEAIETIQENDEDIDAETLQEPMREANKAAFDWFISSPQLDHMKISFSPSETLPGSDLKMKSSFQLVPETTAGADSDKDTLWCVQGTDWSQRVFINASQSVIMMETFPKTTVDVFALVLESEGRSYFWHIMML